MIRAYALDLQEDPELIARYEAWHQPGQVPTPVLARIAAAGIEVMQIFRTGTRLCMVTSVEEAEGDAPLPAPDPQTQDWEALMDQFQQPLPWAKPGEKWLPMACIFDSTHHHFPNIDESDHA